MEAQNLPRPHSVHHGELAVEQLTVSVADLQQACCKAPPGVIERSQRQEIRHLLELHKSCTMRTGVADGLEDSRICGCLHLQLQTQNWTPTSSNEGLWVGMMSRILTTQRSGVTGLSSHGANPSTAHVTRAHWVTPDATPTMAVGFDKQSHPCN